MEPMPLVFGDPDEEVKVRRDRHRVMSCQEPIRPSISIRSIGDYDLIRTIGSGSTGKVKLAVNRVTKEKLAVKIVPRRQLDPSKKPSRETVQSRERRILREAAILNLIDHRHIVKLRDFLITTDYFCMFFEYVDGVQLLDYIISHRKLKEKQARAFFRQILSAVDYCHRNSIVHRDLKIENILVNSKTGDIKLLDFGLSNFYRNDECLETFCGSLYFAAPELLKGTIYTGPEVDVWSLGVVLFVLVTGHVPFDDKNLAALHEKIKSCRLEIPEGISDRCRELLTRMICRDPSQRATMDDVIFHPWVNEGYSEAPAYMAPERLPIESVDPRVVAFLEREFDIQYSPEEIRSILNRATHDWSSAFQHPVVSLYFLAHDKLLQDGTLRTAPLKVDKQRSRSLSFIPDADSSGTLGPLPEAHLPDGVRQAMSAAANIPAASSSRRIIGTIEEGNQQPEGFFLSATTAQPRASQARAPSSALVRRSKSLSEPPPPPNRSDEDYLGIRTVYLKGFFSINCTSNRSAMAIRNEILQYLILHNIRYEDRRSYFVCQYLPSFVRNGGGVPSTMAEGGDAAPGRVTFEIHIVKVAFVGIHGLQFKRIQGQMVQYKNLVSQMIHSLKI